MKPPSIPGTLALRLRKKLGQSQVISRNDVMVQRLVETFTADTGAPRDLLNNLFRTVFKKPRKGILIKRDLERDFIQTNTSLPLQGSRKRSRSFVDEDCTSEDVKMVCRRSTIEAPHRQQILGKRSRNHDEMDLDDPPLRGKQACIVSASSSPSHEGVNIIPNVCKVQIASEEHNALQLPPPPKQISVQQPVVVEGTPTKQTASCPEVQPSTTTKSLCPTLKLAPSRSCPDLFTESKILSIDELIDRFNLLLTLGNKLLKLKELKSSSVFQVCSQLKLKRHLPVYHCVRLEPVN